MLWPVNDASGDGEPAGRDRPRPDILTHPVSRDMRTFSDGRTPDGLMVMLPVLGAHPHRGNGWTFFWWHCQKKASVFSSRWHILVSHAGILKKKQLSPIVERNCPGHSHNNVPGSASPRGSSSSDGQAKGSMPDQMNGIAMSIKAGTVDGDSSGSEWVVDIGKNIQKP